ncbi:hypothetical protein ACFQ07_34010, partial [Actinomadura adrarensis]
MAGDHTVESALLVSDLARLRTCAGDPSFARIEQESAHLAGSVVHGVRVSRVPSSTVHDLFRRDRPRPPRDELVESLWATLLHMASARGRIPQSPGSLTHRRLLLERLAVINAAWYMPQLSGMTRIESGGPTPSPAVAPFWFLPPNVDGEPA